MKIHRFFTKSELNTDIVLHSQELFNQMKRVLKLRQGEKVILFNGNGYEYVSNIVSYGRNDVEIRVEKAEKNEVSSEKELYLFFSLIKKDNVEWVLQKGTELGVSCFIPIISARSEKKDINMERAGKIVIEAAEQSGRNRIPKIMEVMKLEDVLTKDNFDMPLLVLEKGGEILSKEMFVNANDLQLGILIGPEGGWTPEEMVLFKNRKAIFGSLGSATLRAETAAIACVSILNI